MNKLFINLFILLFSTSLLAGVAGGGVGPRPKPGDVYSIHIPIEILGEDSGSGGARPQTLKVNLDLNSLSEEELNQLDQLIESGTIELIEE